MARAPGLPPAMAIPCTCRWRAASIWITPCCCASTQLRLRPDHFGKALGRHRRTDQEALDLVAVLLPEEVHLRLGLDPLSHHLELQTMSHGDDGPGDRCILAAGGQIADEGLVDLHVIHR